MKRFPILNLIPAILLGLGSWCQAQLSGSYDIGGGNNDFGSPVAAAQALVFQGISGPVIFSIYNGTFDGQVNLPAITGNSATNTITFRAAVGQSPVITSTTGDGFFLNGADYVTISDLEITNCHGDGIYNYYSGTDSSKNNTFTGNYIHNVGTSGSYAGIFVYRGADCVISGNEIEGDYYGGIYLYFSHRNTITNNMIYGRVAHYGIRIYNSNSNCIYHNSVYITYSGASYVMYNDNSNTNTFKNNIFYSGSPAGTIYAFYISGYLSTQLVSDFNDLYAPFGNVGYCNGAQLTLANWQNASGLDTHSVSADPDFASYTNPPNLHISVMNPSPVNNTGTPLPSVTTDFDGDPRSPVHPDIGADEFELGPMHHCVALTPDSMAGGSGPSSLVDYIFVVNNCGTLNDTYNLSVTVTGQPWTHTIKDYTGTTTIDSISVNAGQVDSFLVRVNIPTGVSPGVTSTSQVVVHSRYGVDDILADTSTTTTTAIIILAGEYDIGGGNNDFVTPVLAAQALVTQGVSGPVLFNIFNGNYNGQVNLPPITGVSATNTVTFRHAMGQFPVITSDSGSGFYFTGADYVTIQGLEIGECQNYGIDNNYSGTEHSTHNRFIENYIHIGHGVAGIHFVLGEWCEVLRNEIAGGGEGINIDQGLNNLIANNMIYDCTINGIYCQIGYYNSYYYNSLYISQGTNVFYNANDHSINFKNNILFQAGIGMRQCIYITGSPSGYGFVSDYNDLYAPLARVGQYLNGKVTLVDWQQATGVDLHSISCDPLYAGIAPYNLHIGNPLQSPVIGAGTFISTVTTDFDNGLRDPTHPDIGADEYVYQTMNYCVNVEIQDDSILAYPNMYHDYVVYLQNCGLLNDTYQLSTQILGQPWDYEIRNHTGNTIIDSMVISSSHIDSFIVRVQVPSDVELAEESLCYVIAQSRYGTTRNILSDTVLVRTFIAMAGDYDIGGGNNDYSNVIDAVTELSNVGLAGPVIFNVFSGTYTGQVNLPETFAGLSQVNSLTIQNAPGNSPVITSPQGCGIFLNATDYVTISGLEISNCGYEGIIDNFVGDYVSSYNTFRSNYIHNVGLLIPSAGIRLDKTYTCEVLANEISDADCGIYINQGPGNHVANNMIYGTGRYGIRHNNGNYNTFDYNSIYTSGTYAYYHNLGFVTTVNNNIFYQSGTGFQYAFWQDNAIYLSTDYNDLYAPNAYVGYLDFPRTTLGEWQLATGDDMHSISANPNFVSITPTNLHINTLVPSPVNAAAIANTRTLVDFDGESRDSLNPDIGADEFSLAAYEFCVMVLPESLLAVVPQGESRDYFFSISNCGFQNDTYDLSVNVFGEPWTHVIMNDLGISVIDSIQVSAASSDTFIVRVSVPPASRGLSHSEVVAHSRNGNPRNVLSDTSWTHTSTQAWGEYDIGGGNEDFPDVLTAMENVISHGLDSAVMLNIYSGTYEGQVSIPAGIPGLSQSNPLIIQNAPGEHPIITSTSGSGFLLTQVDYVTIQGLEISNCQDYGIYVEGTISDSSTHDSFIGNYIHNVGSIYDYAAIYLYRTSHCNILENSISGGYYGIHNRQSSQNTIANNMIIAASNAGIRSTQGNDNYYFYNSVYLDSGRVFYDYYSHTPIIKNNIFYQGGSGNYYAFYYSSTISGYNPLSDYNDLYAPNANVGYYSSLPRHTLTEWRSATGLDLHSISSEPHFLNISIGDLHIDTSQSSPVDSAGILIATINHDYDGENRDSLFPDIGADEFTIIVSDYCIDLTPEYLESVENNGSNQDYFLSIKNCGYMNDTYDLIVNVAEPQWTHELLDHSGTTNIDSITVQAGLLDSFIVRVYIPHEAMGGQSCSCEVIAHSRYGISGNMLSDTARITTTVNPLMGGEYDIGGGQNDFVNLRRAVDSLEQAGLGTSVIFNVFPGTYDGEVVLPGGISGLGATNTLTIRSAPGEIPATIISHGNGFHFTGADYVTIQGLEIMNCGYNGILNAYISQSELSTHNRFIANYIHSVGLVAQSAGIRLTHAQDCELLQNEIGADNGGIEIEASDRILVANNIIYGGRFSDINLYRCNFIEIYYNSIFSSAYRIVYHDHDQHITMKNNIFYQTGTNFYVIVLNEDSTAFALESDFNDLYAPNGFVAFYGNTIPNLQDWQTISGLDLNSISADPSFISNTVPYNLHINLPSPVDNAGIPIPNVTTDFDNDLRDATHPDIGADEYTVSSPPSSIDNLVIMLSSTDDSTNITLIWSPALNAQQYHIYKSISSPDSGFTLIGSTLDTIYTDYNAIVGQITSFYYVTADNESLDLLNAGGHLSRGIGISSIERKFTRRYSTP